jgi:hypothetical protein
VTVVFVYSMRRIQYKKHTKRILRKPQCIMASLADSIRKAERGGTIIIDKKSYASRGNGMECIVTSEESMTNDSISQGDSSNYWKKKYEELMDLNRTVEREFHEFRQACAQKESASVSYIRSLEQKLSTQSNSNSSAEEVEDLNNKLSFYELMTGMTVTMQSAAAATCTVKNAAKRRITRFNIILDENYPQVSDVHFEPTGNIHLLPDFLQANLSMEASHTPELLINVLNSLYDDDNGAADESAA